MVKQRRITKKDHDAIAKWITAERDRRAALPERKAKERIWREIDRQVAMEEAESTQRRAMDVDWRSKIEPGMLADGLEINSADVLRIAMPTDRNWFKPAVEMPFSMDELDEPEPEDILVQRRKSGVLRSLMTQQHIDTGLRERIKLSIKEAYKHGAFVAEISFENFPRYYKSGGQEDLGAPMWMNYSMWDCFPDPSPSVPVAGMSYQGAMIINFKQKWEDIERNPKYGNKAQIKDKARNKRKNGEDCDGIKYFGDLWIPREDGDIYLPNMRVVVIEETLVFAEENDLPFSPIIYVCPEKDDVRDSYSSSMLIKRSPMHKVAAKLLNDFVDATALTVEPPVKFNSLDPRFARDGGPMIAPRAQIPTRGKGEIEPIFIANPKAAFDGFQVIRQMVQEGTAVDATRSGVSDSVEQTAFEVSKKDQKAEIRTIDFVGVLERQGLRPFLYMQHEYNKLYLNEYPFYNPEPMTPDFLRASKSDLQKELKHVHFEITGSKSVLGEEQRRQGVLMITQQLQTTPVGQQLMGEEGLSEVARDVFADFGVKDPYRYLPHAPEIKDGKVVKVSAQRLQQLEQNAQQTIQQFQEMIGKLHAENIQLQEENTRNATDLKARQSENSLLTQTVETLTRKGEIDHQIQQRLIQEQDRRFALDKKEAALDVREQMLNMREQMMKAGETDEQPA